MVAILEVSWYLNQWSLALTTKVFTKCLGITRLKHTQKKKMVNEAIIEMVDGLITATETFLRHETFTSQPGGFSLIHGVIR